MFRFEIGDVLIHKAASHLANAQRFCVIGRLTEECKGGIQEFYLTRGIQVREYSPTEGAVTEPTLRFFEFELEGPMVPPEGESRKVRRQEWP